MKDIARLDLKTSSVSGRLKARKNITSTLTEKGGGWETTSSHLFLNSIDTPGLVGANWPKPKLRCLKGVRRHNHWLNCESRCYQTSVRDQLKWLVNLARTSVNWCQV